jgi:hypothetical protein
MTAAETLPMADYLNKRRVPSHLKELINNCEAIASADPGDTHAIATVLEKMIVFYYDDVRRQAMLSFWSALVAGTAGVLVLLYTITHTMSTGVTDKSIIGLVAGVMAQFISGVSFYLYFKVARQFASFHICLERTNRYLLANTIAESLGGAAKELAKQKLVKAMVSAPMLTVEAVTGKT